MKSIGTLILLFFWSQGTWACDTDVSIIEGSTITICQGSGTSINASSGYVNYSWTGPVNGNSSSIVPTQSGTYTIDAEDALGCISSASIDVTISPTPTPTLISSEGNILCPGQSTVISTIEGYTSYQWSTGSTQALITINQGGVYSVQVEDMNGCIGNAAMMITVPNFSITANTTNVCIGGVVVLTATGGGTYSWSTGETGNTIVVGPTENSTYEVSVTNGTCNATLSETITVEQVPASSIETTFYVQPNTTVNLYGPDGYDTYSWYPYDFLAAIDLQNTSFNGTESVSYGLTSSLIGGCQRVDSIYVIVIDLTVPTGFSPNNDNINDHFVIPELELYSGEIMIWNRWGDKVFESDHYLNNWDGTCKEPDCLTKGPLPEGSYFYQVKVKDLIYNGYTTLKR